MCLCIIKDMVKDFKLHFYAWIEFFIWLLILCFIVGGIKVYHYKKTKTLKTYQIFMPDVDGMIVGSPVKFMGVQVGYVNKIDIVNNTVYVKFVITEKDVTIPQGSIATVEFNGLGGSKSLEITQPTQETIASKQFIVVNQPKRLNASISLLNDMFDKLGAIGTRSAYFLNQFDNNTAKIKFINPALITNEIDKVDSILDKMEKNNKDFKNRMKEWKR